MCNKNNHKGDEEFQEHHKVFRRGDIIGVEG
jgi:lysyl-tRNA synthetase class II